jgi:exosortase A-associated hydrolase 2
MEPRFIPGPAGQLFAAFHAPAGTARMAALVLPPLFEEKKPSYRPLRDLAEALARRGAAVLRFDYRGTGDSAGSFRDLTVAAMRQDAGAAAAYLRTRAPGAPLALIGLRVGATLAIQEAKALGAERVVALAPVIQGKRFVSETVRKKQVRGMLTAGEAGAAGADVDAGRKAAVATIDLDGFETSPVLLAEIEAMDLSTTPAAAGRTLLVEIGARSEASGALRALAAALGAGAEVRAVKQVPFWNLTDETKIPEIEGMAVEWMMGKE